MSSTDLATLDRILDELDQLATSEVSSEQFLATVLARVRLVLHAPYATVLFPAADSQGISASWLTMAASGECPQPHESLLALLNADAATLRSKLSLSVSGWVAVGIRSGEVDKGVLCVASSDATVSEITASEIAEILNAFAEIILAKQRYELESFLDHQWTQVLRIGEQIAACSNQAEANKTLVNCLSNTLGVLRTSLISRSSWGRPTLVAVSGSPSIDQSSPIAASLTSCSQTVFEQRRAAITCPTTDKSDQHDLATSVSPFHLALPLERHDASDAPTGANPQSDSPIRDVLILEFPSRVELTSAVSKTQQVVRSFECIWDRQRDWLKLPSLLRIGARHSARPLSYVKNIAKYALAIGSLVCVAWLCFRPIPLRIEATGAFEPEVERTIFATNSGILVELKVEEGDVVQQGDELARIHSPELELARQELSGELASLREESASLQIAINQLDSRNADLARNQLTMATKIRELQTKERSILEQLALLEKQVEALTIAAPVSGTVVGKDLAQQLAARPVARGAPLFKVVDLGGPWHLRLQVADRDLWYAFHNSDQESHDNPTIEFSFDRAPKEKHSATVTWRAQRVENRHGEGNYSEVLATAPGLVTDIAYSGTGVHAYFDCGEYPTWFVWCRPFVEALQRRFWLGTLDDLASVADDQTKGQVQ